MLMPTGIQDRKRIHTAPTNPKVTKFGPKNYHREIALSPLEFHCFPPVRHSASPYFYFQNDLSSSPPGQSIQITFISIIHIINYFLLINSYNLQLKSGAPQKLSAIYLSIYLLCKQTHFSLGLSSKTNKAKPRATCSVYLWCCVQPQEHREDPCITGDLSRLSHAQDLEHLFPQGLYAIAWQDSYLIAQCPQGENTQNTQSGLEGAGSRIPGSGWEGPELPQPQPSVQAAPNALQPGPAISSLHFTTLRTLPEPRPAGTEERRTDKIIKTTKPTKMGRACGTTRAGLALQLGLYFSFNFPPSPPRARNRAEHTFTGRNNPPIHAQG